MCSAFSKLPTDCLLTSGKLRPLHTGWAKVGFTVMSMHGLFLRYYLLIILLFSIGATVSLLLHTCAYLSFVLNNFC